MVVEGAGRPGAPLVAASIALGAAVLGAALSCTAIAASWVVLDVFVGALLAAAASVVVLPLVASAAVGLLRGAGLAGRRSAIVIPSLALVAAASGAFTSIAWTLGFDAADEGLDLPGWLQPAMDAAVPVGCAAGAVVLTALLDAALRTTPLPRPGRAVLALGVGVVGSPVLGLALFVGLGTGSLLLAAAAFVVALLVRRPGTPAPPPPGAPVPPRTAPSGDERPVLGLALVALTIGAAGVVVAFAGGPLAWFGMDGTEAMRAGLQVGVLGGVPLALAVGRLTAGRRRSRAVVLLLVSALPVDLLASLRGESGDGVLVLLLGLCAALLVAAGAVLVQPHLPGTVRQRTAVAAVLAVVALLMPGPIVAAVLGFAVPVTAAVLLAVVARRRRLPVPA